jgi:hypothetical protein
MTALYRCGRTEQALSAYEDVRRTLRDELGVTPGPELRRVHQQILEHDAALEPVGPRGPELSAGARDEPAASAEVHLPATMTALVGREADLTRVEELLGTHRLVTLTGTAGTGKTRLAVEVARRVALQYPDGVWFIDLAPLTGGEPITEVVLSTIGGTPPTAGSADEAMRTALRGRRMLLIVDNCEHVLTEAAEVLVTMLSSGTALTVLTTSREQLELDGELIYPVEPLDPDESAIELFLERLRSAAPHTEATADTVELRERAVEICTALDGLPLAIELAAARARVFGLAEIRDQIRSDPTQLARIGRPGAATVAAVRAGLGAPPADPRGAARTPQARRAPGALRARRRGGHGRAAPGEGRRAAADAGQPLAPDLCPGPAARRTHVLPRAAGRGGALARTRGASAR